MVLRESLLPSMDSTNIHFRVAKGMDVSFCSAMA